jgi:hypothetical protein
MTVDSREEREEEQNVSFKVWFGDNEGFVAYWKLTFFPSSLN